jgi:N-acetylmuramic acid 6-phosphate etherase
MKRKSPVLQKLTTEQPNRASVDLDLKSGLEIARIINAEDAKVPAAIAHALPQIGRAIDVIASQLRKGGRLIYVGTGTSGRVGALDASECAPTFGIDPSKVQYMIAGGTKALAVAVEASEDSRARRRHAKRKPGKNDVIVGVATSGRTPTIAAVEYAHSRGAQTIAVT